MSFRRRPTMNELDESGSDIFSDQFTNSLSSKTNTGFDKAIESKNSFSQNTGTHFLNNSPLKAKQSYKKSVCETADSFAKKKIPGPAGTLPKLKEGQGINENLIPQANTLLVSQRNQKGTSNSTQPDSQPSLTSTWNCAMSDLGTYCPKFFRVLDRFPLGSVSKRAKMKTLPSCKVPVICASIESIFLHNIDASVVLKDASGSMPGALHREIVKEYGHKIYVGTVLVLKQVGVFSPALGRNCYLNITPNNVIRIYTRTNQVASQEESPCIIKIQDSDFCDLTSFCDSVMKLPDSSCSSSIFNSPNPARVTSNLAIKSSNPKSFGTKENLPNNITSGNMIMMENQRSEWGLHWEATDISAELLDDWIDDEEMNDVIQQESKLNESITAEPILSKTDNNKLQEDSIINIHPKTKSTNIFSIDTNDEFMLSFEILTKSTQDADAVKLHPSVNISNGSGFKRGQIGNNSNEITKKSKVSTPKKHLTNPKMVSQQTPQPPTTSIQSSHLQITNTGQLGMTNFKFKPITRPAPLNPSSQDISSQMTQINCHQNISKDDKIDSKPAAGQAIPTKTVENVDREFFEKLLEGLGDEMLDDF